MGLRGEDGEGADEVAALSIVDQAAIEGVKREIGILFADVPLDPEVALDANECAKLAFKHFRRVLSIKPETIADPKERKRLDARQDRIARVAAMVTPRIVAGIQAIAALQRRNQTDGDDTDSLVRRSRLQLQQRAEARHAPQGEDHGAPDDAGDAATVELGDDAILRRTGSE